MVIASWAFDLLQRFLHKDWAKIKSTWIDIKLEDSASKAENERRAPVWKASWRRGIKQRNRISYWNFLYLRSGRICHPLWDLKEQRKQKGEGKDVGRPSGLKLISTVIESDRLRKPKKPARQCFDFACRAKRPKERDRNATRRAERAQKRDFNP